MTLTWEELQRMRRIVRAKAMPTPTHMQFQPSLEERYARFQEMLKYHKNRLRTDAELEKITDPEARLEAKRRNGIDFMQVEYLEWYLRFMDHYHPDKKPTPYVMVPHHTQHDQGEITHPSLTHPTQPNPAGLPATASVVSHDPLILENPSAQELQGLMTRNKEIGGAALLKGKELFICLAHLPTHHDICLHGGIEDSGYSAYHLNFNRDTYHGSFNRQEIGFELWIEGTDSVEQDERRWIPELRKLQGFAANHPAVKRLFPNPKQVFSEIWVKDGGHWLSYNGRLKIEEVNMFPEK